MLLRLRDASNGIVISIGEGERSHPYDPSMSFEVSIACESRSFSGVPRPFDELNATVLVYDCSLDGPPFAGFVRELAEDWQGQQGDRTWESCERELQLDARRDAGGLVRLTFTLRNLFLQSEIWSARATVPIEPGEEMNQTAQAIERLVGGMS